MKTLEDFQEVVNGLLEASAEQMDPSVKPMIRTAQSLEDWAHVCKVCEDMGLVDDLMLRLMKAIGNELNG